MEIMNRYCSIPHAHVNAHLYHCKEMRVTVAEPALDSSFMHVSHGCAGAMPAVQQGIAILQAACYANAITSSCIPMSIIHCLRFLLLSRLCKSLLCTHTKDGKSSSSSLPGMLHHFGSICPCLHLQMLVGIAGRYHNR